MRSHYTGLGPLRAFYCACYTTTDGGFEGVSATCLAAGLGPNYSSQNEGNLCGGPYCNVGTPLKGPILYIFQTNPMFTELKILQYSLPALEHDQQLSVCGSSELHYSAAAIQMRKTRVLLCQSISYYKARTASPWTLIV